MVEVIRKQKLQLEESLRDIHNYVSEVEELYSGEHCWPPEDNGDHCDEEVMMQKIVGNPIYNYQMLKRLLVYWKNMEESIKKIDTKGKVNDWLKGSQPGPHVLIKPRGNARSIRHIL